MTFKEILTEVEKKLEDRLIKNAGREAGDIVSLASGLSASQIIGHYQDQLSPDWEKKIKTILKKRLRGWPLAYLSGRRGFYNLEFEVSRDTLIPRPESELIIDQVIKAGIGPDKTILLDIGTGSACLIISLANIFRNKKNVSFYGSDISSAALNLARINAKKYNLKINFLKGDLLKPALKKISHKTLSRSRIIILANLPYLTKDEIRKYPELKLEPKKALAGGSDGLKYHRRLIDQVRALKSPNNQIELYQEIGPKQKDELITFISKKLKDYRPRIETFKDLAGYDRLLVSYF